MSELGLGLVVPQRLPRRRNHADMRCFFAILDACEQLCVTNKFRRMRHDDVRNVQFAPDLSHDGS